MAYDDYAPVTTPEDEEERRLREGGYAPVPSQNVIPKPESAPLPPPDMSIGALKPEAIKSLAAVPAVNPQFAAQRPQWKDYAPVQKHGWGRVGQTLGEFFLGTQSKAENRAQQAYKNATAEYEAPSEEAQREATTKETQARAGKETAETEAIKNPQPKVGTTPEEQFMNDALHGDKGNPRMDDEGKPYTYLTAHQAWKETEQGTKRVPVGNDAAKQYNDSILRELNINPKTAQKAIPPEYEVKPGDTDAEAKEKLQRAKDLVGGATGQQKIVVQQGQYGSTRLDKSYDLSAKRLDETRKPVDDTVRRMGRLVDTLNQHSPQADALVAPELLTVMAGGQGSGLRMNEAEIARIVGGRSVWENLKASIQHWATNPDDARSITPDQDRQIRSLIDTVHQKLLNKQKILDKANEDLLDAQDVTGHRKIVSEAQKALDAIDGQTTTEGKNEPPRPAHVPENYVYKENGPKGKGWYKP